MSDHNVVSLVGRLTRDAELKYTQAGAPVAEFSVASNYRRKTGEEWKDEVNFVDVTMFGKGSEAIHKYLVKGKQVAILAELRQDRWEKDGQKRSRVYLIAHDVQLLGDAKPRDGGEPKRSDDGFEDEPPF